MNRPDFQEINRLIGQLQKLEAGFEGMFSDAPVREEQLGKSCEEILRAQAVRALADIPVEELKNARAGIRVAALRQAGCHTLRDLYEAGDWKLQAVDGIGEKQTAAIRTILDEFTHRLASHERIRLTEIPENDRQGQDLLVQLARCRLCGRVLKDAAPLREELHREIEKKTSAIKIRSRLRWFFSGRQLKEETILSVADLVLFWRSPVRSRAQRFVELYGEAARTDAVKAREDFRKNSAAYYALLEKAAGTAVPQEMVYSSIPAQLAAQIDARELDLTHFKGDLRAYQSFGTRYILTQKRVLLGDEMGLGKTVQAIAAMAHLQAEGSAPAEPDPPGGSARDDLPGSAGMAEKDAVSTPVQPERPAPRQKRCHFLIVCPASVMINWCRELTKFSDIEPHLLHGRFLENSFARWKEDGGAAVINYEGMGKVAHRIDGQMRLALLVIDEAHYIKNPGAKRTRLIHTLEDEADRILMMTGTPLENKVDEMCELIGFLRPDMVGKIRENAGMRHVPAFREMLAPVYLRRQRDQVLSELPPLTREEEWCEMTPADTAAYSVQVLAGNFTGMRRVSFLQEDLRTSAKAVRLAELCAQAREEDRKVVIYSYFRETIRKVRALLEDCFGEAHGTLDAGIVPEQVIPERNGRRVPQIRFRTAGEGSRPDASNADGLQTMRAAGGRARAADEDTRSEKRAAAADRAGSIFLGEITGSTPAPERQVLLDRFADAPGGGFLLCQVQAGGTGLNIQAASVVIFCEPQIKPSLTRQAVSRVYRMGQVQNVLVYHLLCVNTVDEAVTRILEEKQAEFDLFAEESVLADAADSLEDREWIRRLIEEEHRKYLPVVRE